MGRASFYALGVNNFMGLLDRLLKRQPQPSPVQPTTLDADSFGALLDEALERAQALPEAQPAINEALTAAAALKRAVAELAAAPISREVTGFAIAASMRQNFCTRAPRALEAIERAPQPRCEELEAWARGVGVALGELLKALSDNRYLFTFFTSPMKAIAASVEALNAAHQRLRSQLAAKGTHINELHEVKQLFQQFLAAQQEIMALKQSVAAKAQEAARLESECEGAQKIVQGFKEEARFIEAALGEARAQREQCTAAIAQALSPLPRLLRKFAKATSDKALASAAASFAQEPLRVFVAEPQLLERLLPPLMRVVKGLEQEPRAVAKASVALEALAAKLPRLKELAVQVQALEEEVAALELKYGCCEREAARVSGVFQQLRAAQRELVDVQRTLVQKEAMVRELRHRLTGFAAHALGRSITLKD